MYQFTGTAKIFNDKYWRTIEIRVKASGFPSAISRGTKIALSARNGRERITAVSITLARLGRIVVDRSADKE